jgi:hypothetical protein
MKPAVKPYILAIVLLSTTLLSHAQNSFQGDGLVANLDKEIESTEVKNLLANYSCETANPNRCVSTKNGVELLFKNRKLNEIHLYATSSAYGNFKGTLPKGLRFGMSSGDVRAILGKPTVNYNSGYSEYTLPDYDITCWFDAGRLSQVSISSHTSDL